MKRLTRLRLPAALVLAVSTLTTSAWADYDVYNTNDSGPGSLRAAILAANATPDQINIDIATSGIATIRPLSPLPRLETGVVLNGYTQSNLLDPVRKAVIDGSLLTGPDVVGLRLGDNCRVQGITVANFRSPGGTGVGIRLEGSGSRVTGSYVGTDATGTVAQGNDVGILVSGNGNTVGHGFEDDLRLNIVAGNGVGIAITSPGTASGNAVQQTWVGLGRTGASLPNTSHGIRIAGAQGSRIGGDADWERVHVAFNGGAGVAIEGPTDTDNALRRNAIHANGGLGIDLGSDGVTPNDPGDADNGPNGLQNFPIIESVTSTGESAEIRGHLDSAPNQTYTIEFHASGAPDPSGHGEAEWLLRTAVVTTDAAGVAAFVLPAYGLSSLAPFVSATASDATGNTSELGPAVEATGVIPAQPVYTVNVTDNLDLGPCSPDRCSLREALLAVNRNPNGPLPDQLHPGPGPHVLPQPNLPLTDPVVIDGYTQPGSSPNTVAFGAGGLDTVIKIEVTGALQLEGGHSTVRGVAATVDLDSAENVVEGCFLGTDASGTIPRNAASAIFSRGDANRIGGTSPAARNLISGSLSGIKIGAGANGNVVQGNLIGTTADGHGSLPNTLQGVAVGTSSGSSLDNRIGGAEPGAGNVISGNISPTSVAAAFGIVLTAGSSLSNSVSGTRIQGNWIGLDAEGDDPLPNEVGIGIPWGSAHDNLIGGPAPGEGNVISGNTDGAVVLYLTSLRNRVEGNRVGPAATGSGAPGNGPYGVLINNASGNEIVGNEIRGNAGAGVAVFAGSANRISANAIGPNGALGIDLALDGVTPNDAGDADAGPNGLQNFPVVTQALAGAGVAGTYSGAPNAAIAVEVFANAAPDPSQHGEGQRYLGSQAIVTDAAGNAAFTIPLQGAFAPGEWIAATATGPDGSTSEFGPGATAPLLARRELAHGSSGLYDLSAQPGPVPDEDRYSLAQDPRSSYEVVIDAVSGDVQPLQLERVAADGTTVVQSAATIGSGPSLSLRWQNELGTPVAGETIRVRSGFCTTTCGTDDVYRIRVYDTTCSIPRFNNSGSQVTNVLLQNPGPAPVSGSLHFWSTGGGLLASQPFSIPGRGLFVLNTSIVTALAGQGGSITVTSDAPYGTLTGKAVALEPATGFSFDSPMAPRAR